MTARPADSLLSARSTILSPSTSPGAEQSDGEDLAANAPGDSSSRSKLLPRSRTGCWTCRRRKVKCDEARPVCGQCRRLDHICNYDQRISFRDDTPRITKRAKGISKDGCPAWSEGHDSPTRNPQPDILPSFRSLLNDEDREKKAAHHTPGKYHVVVGLHSFSSLPEYSGAAAGSASDAESAHSTKSRSDGGLHDVDDADTVVLDRFETPHMRMPPRQELRIAASRDVEEDGDEEEEEEGEEEPPEQYAAFHGPIAARPFPVQQAEAYYPQPPILPASQNMTHLAVDSTANMYGRQLYPTSPHHYSGYEQPPDHAEGYISNRHPPLQRVRTFPMIQTHEHIQQQGYHAQQYTLPLSAGPAVTMYENIPGARHPSSQAHWEPHNWSGTQHDGWHS